MKSLEPIFIENSKIPVVLSKLAPINIWAISLGMWVLCRGSLNEKTKRHECIHFQQQLECLFIGFYMIYILSYLYNLVKFRDPREAYYQVCFEREAFGNESQKDYLENRKRYAWAKYINRDLDYKERIRKSKRNK